MLIVYNVTECELLLAVGVVDVRWSGRVMRLGNVRNTQNNLYLKNLKINGIFGLPRHKNITIFRCWRIMMRRCILNYNVSIGGQFWTHIKPVLKLRFS